MRILAVAAASVLLLPAFASPLVRPLAAQGTLVDEGTFVISRAGAPLGRESFRIYRMPSASGELYRSTAQVALGARRMAPKLVTDTLGAPVEYEVDVHDGGPATMHLQARTRPGRFSVVVQTAHGESAREYAVPAHTVVLDDDIYSQYFFVGRTANGGAATVLLPLTNGQTEGRIERRGVEPVEIGGKSSSATHYVIAVSGHGEREFWVDSAGRLLRVTIPQRGIVAQRDELPR